MTKEQPQAKPLTQQERQELEQLREEKQKREAEVARAAQAQRERDELADLKAEAAAQKRIEVGKRVMEPGADLKMPFPEKILIIAAAIILIVCIIMLVNTSR